MKRTLSGSAVNNGAVVSTYYIYDGERPILEYDVNTAARVGYNLYGKGIDEILKRGAIGADSQWHWYYLQQNHEGSVTLLIDSAGSAIEKYRYDAFGAPTIYDGNWNGRSATIYDNRFLFTGREYATTYRGTYTTPAFNFYEYRARAYSPTLGRFMSEDPKLFDAGDYNLFRYCHNDPLDLTDPLGMDAVSNGDGTYHFTMRTDIVPNMIGGHVVDSHGSPLQCAGAGQFLTGTRTPDWKWHDAPQARHGGWTQGPRVTKDTPNGTMIARQWENGVYPNKGVNEYNAEAVKKDPSIINHTGIKVGWQNNQVIVIDQWKGEGGSLKLRHYDPNKENWCVVNAKTQYNLEPTASSFKLEQTIEKGTQQAQVISAQHQHSQEDRRQ